ncbi:hypothetical protein, partial [Caballeronia sp.]|uniref:hypothetical protein n=1 Tax=Caballeronia sp. TaxID=1931223 RepID=UPI003C319B32
MGLAMIGKECDVLNGQFELQIRGPTFGLTKVANRNAVPYDKVAGSDSYNCRGRLRASAFHENENKSWSIMSLSEV